MLSDQKLALFLKNLLYIVIVPALVAVYVPLYLVHDRAVASQVRCLIAIVLLGIGAAMILKSVWDFAALGEGTPVPIDAPRKLVIKGIYRYTRNPIYIGILAMVLGLAVMYQSKLLFIYAFWSGVFFQGFIVFYEERHLRKIFGEEYARYCEQVNRWLPKLERRPEI